MPNKIFAWLVYSRLTMGLQAAGIVLTTMLLLNLNVSILLLFVVCTFSSAVYHFNRKTDLEEDLINEPEKIAFLRKTKFLDILYPILFILVVVITAIYNIYASLMILVAPVLGFLYYSKWIPKSLAKRIGARRIKELPYAKSLFISGSWSLFVILTAVYYSIPITSTVLLIYFFVFLRFFINTVVYDMKDVVGDKKVGIRTLPVLFGITRTVNFLMLLNVIAAVYLFVCIQYEIVPTLAHGLNLITIYVFYYLLKARQKGVDIRKLCYLFVDGEFIVWPVLALIGAYISGISPIFGFI